MSDIEIIFQKKGEKNESISINSNQKFSELIEKYYRRKCISKRDSHKLKFFFMENEIMPSSQSSLKDLGIKNSSDIKVEYIEKKRNLFSALVELQKNQDNKNKSLFNFNAKDYKPKSEQIKKEQSKKNIKEPDKESSPKNTIEMIKNINNFSEINKEEIIKKKKSLKQISLFQEQ